MHTVFTPLWKLSWLTTHLNRALILLINQLFFLCKQFPLYILYIRIPSNCDEKIHNGGYRALFSFSVSLCLQKASRFPLWARHGDAGVGALYCGCCQDSSSQPPPLHRALPSAGLMLPGFCVKSLGFKIIKFKMNQGWYTGTSLRHDDQWRRAGLRVAVVRALTWFWV